MELLSERVLCSREHTDQSLAIIYQTIQTTSKPADLESYIEYILKDCEIYYNMPTVKALDALAELSALATIYVLDGFLDPKEKEITIYKRICALINTIKVSYPGNMHDSNVYSYGN